MRLPQVEIHSRRAIIEFDSEPSRLDIYQGRFRVESETTPARVVIDSTMPVVLIDLSKTHEALSGGTLSELNRRIYSQLPDIAREGIRLTNEKWARIANLHDGERNPIAEIALERLFQEGRKIEYMGPASSGNVSFEAVLHKPQIDVTPGHVVYNADITPPSYDFHRGGVQYAMKQYPSVTTRVVRFEQSV